MNQEKGLCAKRATIKGVNNAIALHEKKDHQGVNIQNENKQAIPVDYVSTGNNHHISIYRDKEGNLHEKVVSLFKAVTLSQQGIPIIDKMFNRDIGWQFLFSMKQNEMFVFPAQDFNPEDHDLMNPENASLISEHLFRVQKLATKNYVFRHHLETQVTVKLDFTYRSISSCNNLAGIVKVRLNHLGIVVSIGEY